MTTHTERVLRNRQHAEILSGDQLMGVVYDLLDMLTPNNKPASIESVGHIMSAGVGDEGRSEWRWFWVPDGPPLTGCSLIFGCYPYGETFFATEGDHSA